MYINVFQQEQFTELPPLRGSQHRGASMSLSRSERNLSWQQLLDKCG